MLNRLKLLDFLLFYDLCAAFCRTGSYVGSLLVSRLSRWLDRRLPERAGALRYSLKYRAKTEHY
jgi:hypothetical protein